MKCKQCGLIVDVLPDGSGECRCPNCGYELSKDERDAADGDGMPSPTDTSSATHLKIAKTVNVGFGDFASVLAATDASKIVASDTRPDADRTRTGSSSTLNVVSPDDDDDVLPSFDIYDEDDEYARIQADIAARQKAVDARAAELDAREKYLNKKLDELIAEKEYLRSGIEKSDKERASYLKQKDALDAQRAAMEKEMAARKASLDARAAEIDRKNESLGKARASLQELKRELDASLTGEQTIGDGTSSSISIPYSAKLLRLNNKLTRTVRIQSRVLFCLCMLILILLVLLFDAMWKNKEHESKMKVRQVEINLLKEELDAARAENTSSEEAVPPETNNTPAPESESSGGGL